MANVDLKAEKLGFYLKLITESVLITSKNEGSLRKHIWDYALKTYSKEVDYYDFLLAIRRFTNEGKLNNKEGFYSMHHEVIEEYHRKKELLKKANNDEIVKQLKDGVASAKKLSAGKGISKSVAGSGPASPKQSKIQNYFRRKQLDPFGFENFDPAKSQPAINRGLGFATPGDPTRVGELLESKSEPKR
jgi:hypothetical protein